MAPDDADLDLDDVEPAGVPGRGFPLARLASRLMCPNCGGRNVQVAFDVPGGNVPVFIPKSPWRGIG